MVDFKVAPVKRYANLPYNKASQQFISVPIDILKQALGYVAPFFGAQSVKQTAAASHKINSNRRVQKCQKQPERGVLWNLVLWKWLFHIVGDINFRLKSFKNTLEDVHLQLGCMLLSYNFTKKTDYFFFNILSTIAEQHSCTRPVNGCLVSLQYHFWLQSQ